MNIHEFSIRKTGRPNGSQSTRMRSYRHDPGNLKHAWKRAEARTREVKIELRKGTDVQTTGCDDGVKNGPAGLPTGQFQYGWNAVQVAQQIDRAGIKQPAW